VIHSFYAPNMLYKIQAIPGNVNMFHFKIKAEDEGLYHGQCYQFCGLRHSDMLWVLDARSPAAFQNWIRSEQAKQGITGSDAAILPAADGVRAE
jgi:cytochrome c oxidase subunit 2